MMNTVALDATPQFLTVKEYAGLIRVHPITVYKWIGADRLEGVLRLERTIRIDPDAARLIPAKTR